MGVFSFFDSIKWLTVFEIGLCLINLSVLVRYAIPKQPHRVFDFLPSVGVVTAFLSFLSGDISYLAILIYSLTALIFLCTVKRIVKPTPRKFTPTYNALRIIISACGVIPMVLALMVAGELRYNPVSHLSKMSYAKAFVELNKRLSMEYPFGDWKKIDWIELQHKYEPIFEKADKENNKNLYYRTLREYLYSFRDGHIKIVNENLYDGNEVFKNENGGGVGLNTIQLENGMVLVNLVVKGSPAEKSGIKLGAELLSWDGKAAKEAYNNTLWSESPMTTEGNKILNQGRFMVRASIGKEIQCEFKNMGESEINKVTLKAYDDQYETLKTSQIKLVKEDAPIEGEVLSSAYGYVKIKYLLPSKGIPEPEKILEDKLKLFQEKNLKGLIIDLRDNPGGDDQLVTKMAGYFVNEEKLYEYTSYYNRYTGQFEINQLENYTIKPLKPYYKGNVAIIINSRTGSSGEGLPLALKGLPHVKIVGFSSTNGSFGVVTSPIKINMPEGYNIQLPDGRSLNKEKMIQVDSDFNGQGGVVPDSKIPLNEENFKAKYVNGQDVELNYAIEALKNMT